METEAKLVIYQQDIERVKFVIRSYLRTRLDKIEEQALYILRTPAVAENLSELEYKYCEGYQHIFEKHMQRAFLSQLPQGLQRLDEASRDANMSALSTFILLFFSLLPSLY